MEIGQQLSPQGKRDAQAVGLQQIDNVRVMLSNEFRLRDDPELRQLVLKTAFGVSKGITFGHGIVLKTGDDRNLLAHVMQYERHGGIEPFLLAYLPEAFPPRYPHGPLEQEANRLANAVHTSPV
jgi:hypothetical protein